MPDKTPALELSEQIEKLKDAAYRDYVTGLLNRGAAEIYIENILSRLGQDENCMLIIVDLDNFKMVNDTLGHQTGDKVICTVANILSSLFRPGDVVARLGGDEYVVFLYGNVTRKLAGLKGSDICRNLQLTVGDTKQVSISSSVGIYFSAGSVTFQEMYRMADRALYQAKKRGKNQYYIYEDDSAAASETDEKDSQGLPVIKAAGGKNYSSSSVVLLKDAKSAQVLYADGILCQRLGLEGQALTGERFTDYIHPEDVPELQSILEELTEDEETFVQLRLKSPLGDWIYDKANAVPAEYDGESCILLRLSNVLDTAKKGPGRKGSGRPFFDGERQNGWEVDLAAKRFRLLGDSRFFMPVEEDCAFPDGVIASGWISSESADRFMKFAAGIFTGRVRGYVNALVRSGDGLEYVWATFSYRMQEGTEGGSPKVWGTVEPLNPDVQAEKIPFARKNAVPVPVIDGLVVKLDANVTKDSVNKIWMEGTFQEREYHNKKISYFVVNEGYKIYDKGDKARFAGVFSRENLLELYRKGTYWIFAEYRRIDSAGYIEWVTLSMNLYRKTMDEDVQVRLRINNSDDRHIWECYSSLEDIRNPKTNLYGAPAMREMIHGMKGEAVREFCGAALVRVDGLERIFPEEEDKQAKSRGYVVNMLSYTLGTRCVATKVDEERYLFFFPDIHSPTYLNRLLEMAFSYGKLLLSDLMPIHEIHFFAAVTCMPLKDADYDDLLAMCRLLAEDFSEVREEKIIFRRDRIPEEAREPLPQKHFEKQITLLEPQEGALARAEEGLFSDCLSDMLLAASPERGLLTLFQRLGDYYEADRIYIISLENTNKDIEVFCEWRLPHLDTISIVLSRTSIDKLQLLTRCSIEKKPMCYWARARKEEGEEHQWSYCIFPIRFSERAYTVTDFLCVENPKRREAGWGLIQKLIPYIINQKLRVAAAGENVSVFSRSRLESLPNLLDYMETIPRLMKQRYASMGAFLAKVPRLSILNSHHGFEYGYGILRYVADTFTESLGERYLFRTWDNEFIVLLPNAEKEYVEEKFKSLKVTFDRRYGEHILLSYRWTEGSFTRREYMDMPRAGTRRRTLDVEKYIRSQISEPEEAPQEDCSYTIYLQPVFDLKSGEVTGAEALVRGIGKNGDVILPRRFLKHMEYNHMIKNLDLFVLEKALSVMDRWRERGFREMPLSVNFSRKTILDPTIVASFLAIRSRYPQVVEKPIGIELPQNIDERDYDKLASILEQLREFGAVFAIDDLGVDRENARILKRIRFDTVKIDHSLMVDVDSSETAREMIRAIAGICMEQKAVCLAEGIETKGQLEAARKLGCGCAQGFYYEQPMTVEAFERKYLDVPSK